MTVDGSSMTFLRQEWAALPARLKILEPVAFPPEHWMLIDRLHANFNDREAHTRLPIPIARFREATTREIYEHAKQLDEVETVSVDDKALADRLAHDASDAMARLACLYRDDVDQLMAVLVPSARYRKGHYSYGRFTVPQPHGVHTDHSAEDPGAEGEPICIARIEALPTHYVAGDYEAHDARTRRMLDALRYWTAVPEGEPEHILGELLEQGTLKTIPVNHVVLMVAGNRSRNSQPTQHIAARPPEGGLHSAFFQRQYKLT
jgi:hypothetical protein